MTWGPSDIFYITSPFVFHHAAIGKAVSGRAPPGVDDNFFITSPLCSAEEARTSARHLSLSPGARDTGRIT